jgi:Uma2 family endonuclease
MDSTAKKINKKFTYADYQSWPDDERWEIINGQAYAMTLAPSVSHQKIIGNIFLRLGNYLIGKACIPFMAPTDVVLDEFSVVQPDILVVCDQNKITEANIKGAPDLVEEVLSPSTTLKDRREKKTPYERFGVLEYLLVYPEDGIIERYYLEDRRFSGPELLNWDETLRPHIFPKLEINLKEIFEKKTGSTAD